MVGLFTILAVVTGVISFTASYTAAKKAQKAAKRARDSMSGVLLNKESSIEPIPVIYGERRVGGTRVFMTTSGDVRHEFLYVALVVSEGEVEQISDLEIDEVPATDSRFQGLVSYDYELGTDDQTTSALLDDSLIVTEAPDPELGEAYEGIIVTNQAFIDDFRLRGVAYVAIRLKYDAEVFNGVPDFTVKVKGRKIYDPRQDDTSSYYDASVGVATQRDDDSSTWEWSDNPAICLRDYLTNNRFGKGLADSAIDDAKFMQSADDIDSFEVTPFAGGPADHKLFRLNAVIDTGDELFKNVEQILLSCRGFLPYNFGKYGLRIDQATSSQMTLNTDKIVGDIAIIGSRKEDRFNQVVVSFPNAGKNFRPDTVVWPNPAGSQETSVSDGGTGYLTEAELHAQFVLEDGEDLIDEIELDYCTDRYAARDMARIFCWRSRYALNVAFTATSEAMELEVGDVVSITHPTPDWTAKKFQIDEMSLNYDGTVAIKAIEHEQTIYAYDPDAEEVFSPDVIRPQPDVLPPSSFSGNANGSTLLQDGTFHAVLNMSWTAAPDQFVIEYEVAWRLSGSSYSYLKTPDTSVRIEGIEPGTYQIRVRSINYRGATSDWVIGSNVNVTNDSTIPSLPTNIEARGDLESILVSWTNPTDRDYRGVEVFASDVASTPGVNDTPTAFSTGTGYLEGGLYPGQTRHYFLRSVDFSGNKSDFSTRVFAEAVGIRVRNLALLVNQNAYPTDLPAREIIYNQEYEILFAGTTDFTDIGAANNNVGTVFTATRNGLVEQGSGTVEHTSHALNDGELALVASTLRGAPVYGESGSIVWNGQQIAVEFNNSNFFTVLTRLPGKQGWIAFDRNGTSPFDMSGTLGDFDSGFVYYEDGQWYYDDNSTTPVSFNPDSFTGTTTGSDGTSTAKLVALGKLRTSSAGDNILDAGLFSDPLDLRTVELPENFIDVTKFATQLESDNYSADSAGWKIERSGDVEFNNITARGEIHATSGSISDSVTIGSVPLDEYVSRATGSLALMINKKSGGTLTGNGEAVLVGVEQGAAVNSQNGFITWDGAQVEIDFDQFTSGATFATQVQEQRGFICVDVNKETPFAISAGGGTVNVDVAFVYKIDNQWYYDNNSSSTTGVSFTPSTILGSDGTSETELVAIGFIETGSSDVIKYGGLFGQPVALELAAMPADALESGSIGGIKISNNKLYEGVGTFKDTNTGFYLDSSGDFSLKDKLSFDNSAGELIVKGEIDAEILNVVEANVLGGINATSISDGIVSFDSFTEQALSSLDTRFGRTGGFFDEELLSSYDGTGTIGVSLGPFSHDGVTNFVLSWKAIKSWVSSTNISGDGLKLKVTFKYSSGGPSTTIGSTLNFAATKTQLQNGDFVYDFNKVERLEVSGSTISAGNITLSVTVEEFSSADNCFELLIPQSDFLRFEFVANQDNPNLTVTGTLTAGDITADDATFDAGTNTTINVISNDAGESQIRLYGDSQGTGRLYVGQNNVYGGGIEYNGDNNPTGAGAGSDRIALFRVDNGTYYWTARNVYNSNDWEFRGRVTSDSLTAAGLIYPAADGTSGQVITTDGSGNLSFSTVSGGGSGDITSVIAGTNLTGGATSGAATLNVAQKLTGNVVELTGGIAFDPEGGGSGTDTASDVGIALSSGTRIVGTHVGYIRNLLDWNDSSSIDIGQTNTSLINGINLYGGNGSTPLKYQNGNGYITIGSNNTGFCHFYTDRTKYYFNKKLVVDEGIIQSYDEDLQLAAGVDQAASIVIDYSNNEVTFNEHLNFASGTRLQHNSDASRDKIRLWNSSSYSIGMDNAMSYGHLSDYAMTFQFNNTDERGWVFLDTGHSDAQGAMSLSTNGKMTLATSLSVGEGQSVTSPRTDTLFVQTTGESGLKVGNSNASGGNYNLYMTAAYAEEMGAIGATSSDDGAHDAAKISFSRYGQEIEFYTGLEALQASRMIITDVGDVGIGENDPSGKLHVSGETYTDIIADGSIGGAFKFYKSGVQTGQIFSTSANNIIFRNNTTDTEAMRIDASQQIGINQVTPSARLHVNGTSRFDHSVTNGFRVQATDTTPDQTFYGAFIDYNVSGSTALTATRNHIGLFVDTDSSATGGNTTNEHRVYGIYNDVQVTGDSDFVVGSHDIARTDHSSGAVSNMRGTYGRVIASHTAGSIANQDAGYFLANNYASASATVGTTTGVKGISNANATSSQTSAIYQGGYFLSQVTAANTQNINQLRGSFNDVQIDANSNTFNISNVYVTRSDFDNNDEGSVTIQNAYLYYGQYEGVLPNNAWGIYLPSDVRNYLNGNLGLGTSVITDSYKMIIEGSDQETADLTDAGTHGATLFLRAHGENVGSGGAVAFGTSFGNKRPFAAIKGYILDGTANSIGDLTFSTRASTSATALTERMRISAAGNVLINSSNELQFFNANYGIRASTGLEIKTGDFTRFLQGSTEHMRISSGGNVGIGTSVKVFNANGLPLIVGSGSGNQGMTIYSGSSSSGSIHFADTATTGVDSYRGRLRYDHNAAKMILSSNAIDSVFINNVGRVGINDSDPSAQLSVYGATNLGAIIDFQGNANGAYPTSNFGGAIAYNFSAGDGEVAFWNCWTGASSTQGGFEFNKQTGAGTHTSLMKLAGDGNVGINNESPDSTLNVKGQAKFGDVADSGQMRINATSNTAILESNAPQGLILRSNYVGSLSTMVFATNGSTERMRIKSDGQILIGKDVASINVAGMAFLPNSYVGMTHTLTGTNDRNLLLNRQSGTGRTIEFRYANSHKGNISVTASRVYYNTTSDERLKDNIVDATSASSDIDAIQVRSFDWKADGSHQKYGMVAQELQTVAPDAVSEGETEQDMMGVDYSKLVPMMLKEIQSLRARVAQLENE